MSGRNPSIVFISSFEDATFLGPDDALSQAALTDFIFSEVLLLSGVIGSSFQGRSKKLKHA